MEQIHALKVSDPIFAGLLRDYDEVNDKIHLAEKSVAPISQDHETTLRKQRLAIKDRIAEALRGA